MNKLIEILGKRIVVFDGAMGTMLQKEDLLDEGCPELLSITHGDAITFIHRRYLEAGADVIQSNTFGGNRIKLAAFGLEERVEELNAAAVLAARKARDQDYPGAMIALSVGPTGKIMKPTGPLSFQEAYRTFWEQVIVGARAGADLICIETIADLGEARAAILAAKDAAPQIPVICSMTFQPDGRTLMGTNPQTAVLTLQSLGADILGANCSGGPEELRAVIQEMMPVSKLPLLVQPNAGLPVLKEGKTVFPLTAEEMGASAPLLVEAGAALVGSCCGSDPAYTAAMKRAVAGLEPGKPGYTPQTYITSTVNALPLGDSYPVRIIGERINPTGKKRLSEELRGGSLALVVKEAVEQVEMGADILDINVGLPEVDEKTLLVQAINAVQQVVQVPLQIDTTNTDALEAALQEYHGKALVNSVNGKEESLATILPLVKRYGACVLGLCLDDAGIPATAAGRVRIAARILERAKQCGIPPEDILIDCLVLTASAQQKEVLETIEAVRLVREELKLPVVLGVSNVSFGLPDRNLVNRTFLAMTLAAGLDAPILNPHDREMVAAVRASEVLTGRDPESKRYIEWFGTQRIGGQESSPASAPQAMNTEEELYHAVVNGLKDSAEILVQKALDEGYALMSVVEKILVPALDEVGEKYERGEYFLPQLMQAAEVVQIAFERLRRELGPGYVEKGTIVLATVKGDIHDIGKNIVRVLLENYGYRIVDLGKDVPPEAVVSAARKHQAGMVGLSALMTTTVPSMQETIAKLREAGIDCKIVVGGAVLNQKYATMIGADYYAKDGREGVTIAHRVFAGELEKI